MVEAMYYYSGLCSSPRLVYHTSTETTPWTMPTGPEAYRQLKELHPVFSHKLNVVWMTDLGPRVCRLLDFQGVLWRSIDVVHFIKVGEGEAVGPIVFWIGVTAKSLLGEDAHTLANGCLDLLKEFGITDVEVDPPTPTLGLSIAAQATPHAEGTSSIYLTKGRKSKKVLLVTARHVLFPPNDRPNINYAHTNTSAPRRNVLLGTKAFNNFLDSIKIRIGQHSIMVECHERQIEKLQVRVAGEDKEDIEKATKQLEKAQQLLDDAREAIQALEEFYNASKKNAGIKGFTEDYAVVKLNSSKIKDTFKGNMIDLGMNILQDEFTLKMSPHIDAAPSFEYLDDCLLPLHDLISEDFMHKPDMLDHNGESCLLVIKNGNATGVTIGCATGIFSYIHKYFSNNTHQTSTEWAILPYNNKLGAFSTCSDSGSIIVDSLGHIGGILTGGAGKTVSSDITYATPFFWLLLRIKKNGFPHTHLYPVMASCANNYGQ
ncbi:hypothetical protein PILCRDRAFT_92001 [Piloderma croceum F 1598]|uniref:Uncharacterized protein n=1 Tax=Piloderma croceum (strain F 1598) TaxID=765440 RepID=A0A0C3AP66_PILCF|nr:hypothetical protein PILCRDRAFT_92001 [Piloderma croceum F 1598]